MCVVDVRVRPRSSVGILEEALDLTADLCTALFLHPPLLRGVFGTSNHRDITTNRGWTITVLYKLWPYGRAHLSGR